LRSLHRKLCSTVALLPTLLVGRTLPAQSSSVDLVLIHGHILTVDSQDSVAQAIAIRHGIIVKVGTGAEVLKFAGNAPGIRVLDLHGYTATPGLIDTHAHIAEGGVEELYGVKLSDATSVAEIVTRVKIKVAVAKPGEWVTGSGWDEGKLDEHRYVTAADLDTVSPNNPVWLVHTTGHYGVANSVALKLAQSRALPPILQPAPSTAIFTAIQPASSKKTPRWVPLPDSSRPQPSSRCGKASSTSSRCCIAKE
jgi:predicted amidohydrolase YtcJ